MYRSGCPIANVLDLVGDRWSLLIIRDLFMGKKTFKELLNAPEGIATNILSSRLKNLTKYGFINAVKSPVNKKINFYYLEDKGIDLYPILHEMSKWCEYHLLSKTNKTVTIFSKDTIAIEQTNYRKFRTLLLENTLTT